MVKNELFQQVIDFVIDIRGKYRFPLTMETSLEKDLHITGDDADEFIIAFSKEFNIDISDFDISKYFGSEGGFMGLFGWATPGKQPITLGDLYNAVTIGKLV